MISRSKKRGFTLIEMLVAVLLLTTALTGPLTIASKGLTVSIVAKNQITAFYLAQDAVEYVRFIRETNRLGGYPWLAGLDGTANGHSTITLQSGGTCVSANGSLACYIDSVRDDIVGCNSGNCSNVLRYHATNGYFTTLVSGSQATAQLFKRTVRIVNSPSTPNEAEVTVVVTWCDIGTYTTANCRLGGSDNPHVVVVRENLFNWQ